MAKRRIGGRQRGVGRPKAVEPRRNLLSVRVSDRELKAIRWASRQVEPKHLAAFCRDVLLTFAGELHGQVTQ